MKLNKKSVEHEILKRKLQQSAPIPFDISKFLFSEQLAFVDDPAPNKVAVCSRRSGKTIACAADLVKTAISNQDVVCLYITLSRNNAKKIIWKEIKKINQEFGLGGVPNQTELSWTFPTTGSTIYLSGAKDVSEIEKFRGLALKLVYIDECQSFRAFIQELINDVLAPALMDYAGTLVLIGTPGPIPAGYFAECAGAAKDASGKAQAWSHHAWTFFNNPFILAKSKLSHQQMLDRELKRRGVTAQDPSIQREFFGRWVLDSNSLLLSYDSNRNHYEKLPSHKMDYILGIDLGFDDADALAVVAWSEHEATSYLVEEILVRKQGLTELVDQINLLNKKYDISKMMIDQGGLGKKLAEEMRRRHHLPVQPADKVRKMENIAFLNDALRTGRFKAKANSQFAQDTYLVEIDRDKSTPDSIKVSSRYHSDIIDAVLYAFKESPAFTYEPPAPKLVWGTKEWAEAQHDEMFEAELEGLKVESERLKVNFGEE